MKRKYIQVKELGRIVQVGIGGDMTLPMTTVVAKELSIRGTFRFYEEFGTAVEMMNKGLIDVSPLVFIVSKRHELASAKYTGLTNWAQWPMILSERGLARSRVDRWFRDIGEQPNIYAQVAGNEAIVNLLLADQRILLDLADDNGFTPLAAAVLAKDIRVLRSLLQAGASPNTAEAGTYYTPLHRAVLIDWMEGVKPEWGGGTVVGSGMAAVTKTPIFALRSRMSALNFSIQAG